MRWRLRVPGYVVRRAREVRWSYAGGTLTVDTGLVRTDRSLTIVVG